MTEHPCLRCPHFSCPCFDCTPVLAAEATEPLPRTDDEEVVDMTKPTAFGPTGGILQLNDRQIRQVSERIRRIGGGIEPSIELHQRILAALRRKRWT